MHVVITLLVPDRTNNDTDIAFKVNIAFFYHRRKDC